MLCRGPAHREATPQNPVRLRKENPRNPGRSLCMFPDHVSVLSTAADASLERQCCGGGSLCLGRAPAPVWIELFRRLLVLVGISSCTKGGQGLYVRVPAPWRTLAKASNATWGQPRFWHRPHRQPPSTVSASGFVGMSDDLSELLSGTSGPVIKQLGEGRARLDFAGGI